MCDDFIWIKSSVDFTEVFNPNLFFLQAFFFVLGLLCLDGSPRLNFFRHLVKSSHT